MHLRCLGVRAQEQEGEVIRAEGGQQQRSRALEERLLTWQIVDVLHNSKGKTTFRQRTTDCVGRQQTTAEPHAEAKQSYSGNCVALNRRILECGEVRMGRGV